MSTRKAVWLPRALAWDFVVGLLRRRRVRIPFLVFQLLFLFALRFRWFPGILRHRRWVALVLLIHVNRISRIADFETSPNGHTVRP
jgi:hypothetical protein